MGFVAAALMILGLSIAEPIAPSADTTTVFWVTFVDKGPNPDAAPPPVSERSLRRRAKARPRGPVVSFEDYPVYHPYVAEVARHVTRIRHVSRWFNAVSVEATDEGISAVAALPMVRSVRRAARFRRAVETPHLRAATEPDYGAAASQLAQINVRPLHRLGYTGRGVLVCLLDTGFRKDHESLRTLHVIAERDFVFGDDNTQYDPSTPQDFSDSHGTAVWSALAGYAPGRLIGPAYGASFLLAKTEDLRWELPVEEDHWVAAIEWADSLGADVVSSSLSYTVFDDGSGYSWQDLDGNTGVTTRAADRAASVGIAVVVAAGNYRQTSWGHIGTPADADSVVAVGAVDASGLVAPFSSPGPTFDGRIKPEVCARGVGTACASSSSPSSYGSASGTSLSTPLVAGVAALLLEVNPHWTGLDVREALMATADRASSPDNDYGWGIVDAFAASGLHAPLVEVVRLRVDDDATGASLGNANGTMEPGERIELFFSLANLGSASSSPLTCWLSSPDQAVSLVQEVVTAPALAPGDTVETPDPLVVDYASWGAIDTLVPFTLTLLDSSGDTATVFPFTLPARLLYPFEGLLVETHSGMPIPFGTVRLVGGGGAPPDTLHAAVDGTFSTWLSPGRWYVQARAQGFVSPDATPIDVPGASSLRLHLGRPVLDGALESVFVSLPPDSAASAWLRLRNVGTDTLLCTLHLAPEGEPTRLPAPFLPLRGDPFEGTAPDLRAVAARASADSILLRVSFLGRWPDGVRLVLGLDADGDPTNGLLAAGLLADYAVHWQGEAWVSAALGGRWIPVGEAHALVDDSTLTIGVPSSLLGRTMSLVRVAAAVESGGVGPRWTLDRLPDDGGTDPVVWSPRAPAWMVQDAHEAVLAPGDSTIIPMTVSTLALPQGTYRATLLIQGGIPVILAVPIVLEAIGADSAPAERPTRLEVGLPTPNPAGDGCRLRIGLPSPAPVSLALFDLAGREVDGWSVGVLPAGWTEVEVPLRGARRVLLLRVATPSAQATRIVVGG